MQKEDIKTVSLSKQQKRLWGWLRAKQVDNNRIMLLLEGKLDLISFRNALQRVVERYEILHTTFSVRPDMDIPIQVIDQHLEIPCPLISLKGLDPLAQQNALTKYWQELLQHPFDLEHGPLMHMRIFRLAEQQHILMLHTCALCADMSTLKHFVTEVLQAHAALSQGDLRPDDEEVLQYIDVSSWQEDLLVSDDAAMHQALWHKLQLAQLINMPLPFQYGGKRSLNGRMIAMLQPQQVEILLDVEQQKRLFEMSQHLHVAPEISLLTCWRILLGRLTEITPLIGVACDGRFYEELATALGPYTHSVPFFLPLTAEMSFERALTKTSLAMQEMKEKQLYFTWEVLTPELRQEEQVFPTSFSYSTWPASWRTDSMVASMMLLESWVEPAPLHLQVIQVGQRVQLHLLYQPSVFSQRQVRYLGDLLQTLLYRALATPQVPVGRLTLLTHEQQVSQQERLRGTESNWPFVPLHRLFEEQARRRPQADALRCGSSLLSYEQLELQANQLAHILLHHGLLPGGRVALCLQRDHWAIISLLAVLKAGGTYVPVDMQLPQARLQLLLQQSTLDLVLSSQQLRGHLSPLPAKVLWVEELQNLLAASPSTAPQVEVKPEDLAYVMYTSGSTGVPKGVLIRQSSVSNYTQALCNQLEVPAGWHFATVSSLAADLGNTSIFCGLASGGCVHILPYEQATDAAAFSAYVEQYPLDVLKIVPSHLQTLLAAGTGSVLPRERLILGGEALPWSLVQQVQLLQPNCRLYNHYGPTEATIGALVYPLGNARQIQLPAEELRDGSVPIGRSLDNTQAYILDEQQQWVPSGVVGELYLAGAGLAAGYESESEQNKEGFLELELAGGRQRLYRTGDWVREREVGMLEFVGRRDAQIKLRGYRIEVGEIEEQLRSHPAVREAVVQVRGQEKGEQEQSLVGYIVPWKKPGPGEQEIRDALSQRLPTYAVPSRIVCLERLPLTANGKLDRQRLPEPEMEKERAGSRKVEEALTPIEEVIQQIWRQVLGMKEVGRSEDFFRLGGHSLLGTRVVARLRTVFEIEVPITWLFENPTVAGLSRRMAAALGKGEQRATPVLVPVSREQPLPLSFAQQRLWFLDQLEPGSTAYTVPIAVWLRGDLHAQALQQSLITIITRHEVLRTTFALHAEQTVQQIHPTSLVPLRWVDLTGLPESSRVEAAYRLADEDIKRASDLQRGPLVRIHLLRVSEQQHALLLTMHHTVSDAWSRDIWMLELSTLYAGFLNGTPAQLPDLPVQYADYALWQRQCLQGEVFEQQLTYWRKQLAGLAPLELPIDHPRPPTQSFRGAQQQARLSRELEQQVQALAQQEGVTIFMLLIGAFQVLLSRYSGQHDIAVGTPIANRGQQEIEGLIGFFTNTVVLRTDLSGNPSFVELLAQVRKVALEAYAHQDVPFEQVVEALQPERDRSRSSLFQVMFILQPTWQWPTAELVDIQLEELSTELSIAKFELSLVVAESKQGLNITLEYNTDLFEPATITRMLSHWQCLLEGMVADPAQRVLAVPLLSPSEREHLLGDWNQTRVDYPYPLGLHELVEAQVKQTPEAVALLFEDQHLSYAVLNARANQLARHLRRMGIGPEIFVGVCMDRSPELIVALLAILKAGGVYVPLDPSYPQEQRTYQLEDAQVPLVLTQQKVCERRALPESLAVFCLDSDWSVLEGIPSENLDGTIQPGQLAYMVYTSGSTGRPKGAMNTHQGIVNRLLWMQERYPLTRSDRVLQKTPYSFDVSVWEFFWPLLAGALLVVAEPEGHRDPIYLHTLITEDAITTLHFVPSMLQVFMQQAERGSCPQVGQVFCSGEALTVELQERFFATWPQGVQLHNLYGPTEAAIDVTWWECQAENAHGTVPIGYPIANTQLYILDRQGQPVPIGVIGELFIGGVSVARGYWGRPDLTAERFVPDPFSVQEGARLYRTGDRVCYREDGRIEFLGRKDAQVKVRGYRIELGEIEAQLSEHPLVKQSVVVVQGEDAPERHLVAYVVTDGESIASELRRYLKERLPDYMVPAYVVLLDALPLTSNGKVDRRRLLTGWRVAEPQEQDGVREAFNPLEELVQQVYQEVLHRSHIGRRENFFEIGGHSLLATQVIARLQRLLAIEVPLRVLFETPVIDELAARLQQIVGQEHRLEVPPIVPVSHAQSLPLSFAQQRLWFLEQLGPNNIAYIISNALRLRGYLDRSALEQSLIAIIQRHESLRTTFPTQEGQAVQQIAPGPIGSLVLFDLRSLVPLERETAARRLAQQETKQPFDLVQGPLLRGSLLLLEEQDQVLLLTMHHIISDGWSMSILIRELTSLYAAKQQGEEAALPTLPVQYADYALWQRAMLQGEVLQYHIDYWRKQLAGLTPLDLPTDHPRPPVQSFWGAQQRLQLSAQLSQELRALSQREGVTLFMLLLAAFQILLSRYSGQQDIVVGTPIANRTRAEIEGLIGFFANTLVMRSDLSGNPSFAKLLVRVRQVALGAYTHQEVPFEQLVETLQPDRDLSRNPLFQVMFLLEEGFPHNRVEMPEGLLGQWLEPLEGAQRPVKFDLALELAESEQGLRGVINYRVDLFEAATITRMLGHFQTLLENIACHPERRLSQLPLLTMLERQQLLEEWNNTRTDAPQEKCLHQIFEQQVEQTPDAVAVVFEDQQLTYRELNLRANQLAHYLHGSGVGPDMLVGLCLERSLEMVVGLLAILKAGGAYVPLDPSYPPERLRFMLEDTNPALVLTQASLQDLLPMQSTCLDRLWEHLSLHTASNFPSILSPANLAYIIYTSGSTGRPKGVMNTHQGICNNLQYKRKLCKLSVDDSMLQRAPLSFDASVEEIFLPLISGGRLILARPEGHRDSTYLLTLLQEQNITILGIVPSLLQILLDGTSIEQCRHLRCVLCGGEAMPPLLLQSFYSRLKTATLYNLYGPTEAAIQVTCWECEWDVSQERVVPIGRPIANTQLYLLDEQLNPVPVGVTGELYISGVGLGRGYHQRPDLTAERFIGHPFSQEPGARLYRTGDMARYQPDGSVALVGRMDQQVKLRGLRVELTEIEASLGRLVEVRDAVVTAEEDATGEKRLVGYIVPQSLPAPSVEELRQGLREWLPDYMIPALFVQLEALPLLPNGKVDRRALPASHGQRIEQAGRFVAPQTSLEEYLAALWQELLGIGSPGRDTNFFELGGNSIKGAILINKLQEKLGVRLYVVILFNAPTIAKLARTLAEQFPEAVRKHFGEESLPIEVRGAQTREPAWAAQDGLQHMGTAQGEEKYLEPIKVQPRHAGQSFPLSFAQQRLWFLDQLEPESIAYLIPSAQLLYGDLLVPALEQSLTELVRRHEGLRTTFPMKAGQPVQVIAPEPASFPLPLVDLSGLEQEQRQGQARQLTVQERQRPCNLAEGPLLRVALLRVESREHMLLVTQHHIISDAVSNEVFWREWTTLYQAMVEGQPSPFAPLPLQYADYALWQRAWLQGAVLDEQLAYWQQRLSQAPVLALPTDHPRPPVQTSRGALQSRQLPPDLGQELAALARSEGVTLFMLLLAAFQVLLARYSGQEDICVGTAIANRTRPEIEGLIGFFVNTLVLRTNLSGNPSFAELLRQVREVALGAYAHQDVPFEQIVELLQPERDRSRSPLFQVMFGVQQPNETKELALAEELRQRGLFVEHTIAKFDLTVTVVHSPHEFVCNVEYNTDLFEAATIERLLAHWHTLLVALAADPHSRLADLPLLSPSEQHQLLIAWNQTHLIWPEPFSLLALLQGHLTRQPDAIALVFQQQHLSYHKLGDLADHLAHFLQARGVGPEVRVGLRLSRTPWLVICVLGVLKAGGAYVPLDPTYPAERLAFMQADSQCALVLTDDSASSDRRLDPAVEWINVQELPISVSPASLCLPAQPEHPEQAAYVIYTSGSTGTPRGVLVSHRGLANLAQSQHRALGLDAHCHVLQFASFSFDASVSELVMTISAGATLYQGGADDLLPGPPLLTVLREAAITTITLPPSALHALPNAPLPDLKTLVVAGEACGVDLVQQWAKGREMFNAYGPTEATVCVSIQRCDAQDARSPAIGRPLSNVRVYVLDQGGAAVPIGVAGELYVGGVGLARGYVGRAQVTAERFVPDPWSGEGGGRLYRTGDRVRYRADGSLEYLDRQDRQVKLRGYRIELSEIEAILSQHDQVRESAVIVRGEASEEQRLVAYVVGESPSGALPDSGQLRAYLRTCLPEYMVPGQIVVLGSLPLTSSGKVDRRALGKLESQEEKPTRMLEERTPMEALVAQVWCEVLGDEWVELHENFFELGGHSLLAMRVMERLQELVQVGLSVQELFEAPTVTELAARVEQVLRGGQGLQAPPLVQVSRKQDMPLSFAQQRLWFLDQLEPGSTVYTVASAMRLLGRLDRLALRKALDEVIQRHESLRTTFPSEQGEPRQRIAPVSPFPQLICLDLSALPQPEREKQARRLARQEAEQPFDLAHGPLLRSWLVSLAKHDQVLLLTMHHIISDGWSNGILVSELSSQYTGWLNGTPPQLPALPIQYADYAVWQREWLQGEVLKEQIRYWTLQLNGAHALELPTDYPRPRKPSHRGARYTFQLNAELTQALEHLSRQEGATLFMTLLCTFQVLLSRISGECDVVVGIDSANRGHRDTEGIIGFFINLLALRINLHENPRFLSALHAVREMVLGAYAHQELPFEMIVEHLHLQRERDRTPLVNVLMVMQNVPRVEAGLPDVVVGPMDQETTFAKFDLALFISEGAQGLSGSVVYSTDLFKSETIATLMQNYEVLLHSIITQPDMKIASLEITTEDGKAQKARQQATILQKLKVSRGDRLRISGENGYHQPELE